MLPVLPMLPNGDPLSVERLQTLGGSFGMKPSFERVHWIFDGAFLDGDGEPSDESMLSSEFLTAVESATASNPLYWPLQEFIYADGELERPINWAAQQVRDEHPEFGTEQRPLLFTGEAMFPWMFEQERALQPFRAAMDVLMADTHFGTIYDAAQLARNEVPLQSAVYFDDMYVDSGLQLDTLSRIGRSHYWVTNEFEHDGLHGDTVFRRLYGEALDRGDLAGVFL
jgi:proline iminopeptidase